MVLANDDHSFGRIGKLLELLKQCQYTENDREENERVQGHLGATCEVGIYVLQALAAKRRVVIPSIPAQIAGGLVPRMIFRRIPDKEKIQAALKKTYLGSDFYDRYK